MSLSAVAERAGIAKSTLSDWENGRKLPRGKVLVLVLDVLKPDPGIRSLILASADPAFTRNVEVEADYCAPVEIGQILRALRTRSGKSQSQVAALIGVTQSTIAKWELGEATVDRESIERVSASYGASESERQFLAGVKPAQNLDREDYFARIDAIDVMPVPLQEVAYLAIERELWPQAMRKPSLLGVLISCASVRANQLMEQRRRRELAVLIEQIVTQVKAHSLWTEGSLGYYSYLACESVVGKRPREVLRTKMAHYSKNVPDLPNRYFLEARFGDPNVSMTWATELKSLDHRAPCVALSVFPYELDIAAAHSFMYEGDSESAVQTLLPHVPDPHVKSHSFLTDSLSRVLCEACVGAGVVPYNLDQIMRDIPRDRMLSASVAHWERLEKRLKKLRDQGAPIVSP